MIGSIFNGAVGSTKEIALIDKLFFNSFLNEKIFEKNFIEHEYKSGHIINKYFLELNNYDDIGKIPNKKLGHSSLLQDFLIPSVPALALLDEEDREWAVQITLSSREQAVKVAAILAKGIDREAMIGKGFSIGVEGGVNTGKTLVCDVMAYELIDSFNCYHAPRRNCMFLEDAPDQAFSGPAITKHFDVSGKQRNISFKNFSTVSSNQSRNLRAQNSIALVSFNTGFGQLDRTLEECRFSLLIKLNKKGSGIWESMWTIYIAPELRTTEMKERLEHIRAVDERLKLRRIERESFKYAAA